MNNSLLLTRRYWKEAKFQNDKEKRDRAPLITGNSWNLGQNTERFLSIQNGLCCCDLCSTDMTVSLFGLLGWGGWFTSSLFVKNPPRTYGNAWKIRPSTGLSMKNETQVQKVEGKDYEDNQSWKVKEHKITTGRRMSKQWHGGTTEKKK